MTRIKIGNSEDLHNPAVTVESDHRTCTVVVDLEKYDMNLFTRLTRTSARALIGAIELAIADLSGAELETEPERRQRFGDPLGLAVEK
jgi:hypothetical protein